jgi:hypothetical protein
MAALTKSQRGAAAPGRTDVRSRLRSGRSVSGRFLYQEHEQQGAIVMLLAMAGWQEWTAAAIVAAIAPPLFCVNTGASRSGLSVRNSASAGD